jgi:hypothetical protein
MLDSKYPESREKLNKQKETINAPGVRRTPKCDCAGQIELGLIVPPGNTGMPLEGPRQMLQTLGA